ncbi:MAG: MlaA family lipoprotein [Fluviibacter sp.]
MHRLSNRWIQRAAAGVLLLVALTGCASTSQPANPRDPWEGYNRGMFEVNEVLDKAIIKPVAVGYDFILPDPIRMLVTNLFSNIGDVMIGVNDLLQGRGEQAFNDLGRFVINTTLGFGGLFDVAGNAGWYKNDNDFGVTFGRWGVPAGPYFVLPILGPSDVRDTFGWAADIAASPLDLIIKDPTAYYIAWGVRFLNTRANLLPAEKIIEEAATDKYSYLRDAFMQNRLNLIYDGAPPIAADVDEAAAESEEKPADLAAPQQ